jgi:hypothetical protein
MIKTRTVTEWLELWGDWEGYGRDYTKHLQPRSNMLTIGEVVIKDSDRAPLPELTDDAALWVCGRMAFIKREKPHHYKVLREYYVLRLSSVKMAAFNKCSRHNIASLLSAAEGYAECILEMREAA